MTLAQQKSVLRTLRTQPFNLKAWLKDPRTILKTQNNVVKSLVPHLLGGSYIYLGCEDPIQDKLKQLLQHKIPDCLLIDFSTDGGNVFRVGNTQFLPIQFRIFNVLPKKPMIAGIFIREHKLSNPFEFFEQSLEDSSLIFLKFYRRVEWIFTKEKFPCTFTLSLSMLQLEHLL